MSILDRLATRAAVSIPKTTYSNVIVNPQVRGNGPKAATQSISYVTPGQPQRLDFSAEGAAKNAYLASAYVMRCVQTIAQTIAGLPFMAGDDPLQPQNHNPDSPLARLLGPATIQAPGGPNPTTSSRAFWAWSIVQKKVTGRYAWELVRDPQTAEIFSLWPLVSASLAPIPSLPGSTEWFDGYLYTTPTGNRPLTNDQVFYAWQPSITDWRMPESVLQAASLPIAIQVEVDRYMHNLLKNGMAAKKMVITPPFEQAEDARAFEEQFLSEFTGVNSAGATIFAQAENDYDQTGKMVDQANVQVIDLATSPVDAELLALIQEAKNDICIALGVPRSLIGDASQRIYANADAEYRNFWTLTLLNEIRDLQDSINVNLAPQIGSEVGWFDLSKVAALQPPMITTQPTVQDLLSLGVTPDQITDLLAIPDANASDYSDTSTVESGEEAIKSGGSRSVIFNQAIQRHRSTVFNTYGMDKMATEPTRERIVVQTRAKHPIVQAPELVGTVNALTSGIRAKHGKRSADILAIKGFDKWLEEMTPELLAAVGE